MTISRLFSSKNFYLISYDISDNRSRQRIFKQLKGSGFAVQKSVFECLLTEIQLRELLKRLQKYLDEKTDSIRVYRLCGECVRSVRVIGVGEVNQERLVQVV